MPTFTPYYILNKPYYENEIFSCNGNHGSLF
jgi:hypothetical protein